MTPLQIPRTEISVRVSKASGPGGQHVNKTSSRVELFWNVRQSAVLTDEERERVLKRLRSRLTADGTLRVVSAATRSQHRNRELAAARLHETVRKALVPPKTRRPTAPTAASREARLEQKHRHSEKKRLRRMDVED